MSKWAIQVGWQETPHLSPEAQAALIQSIPPYQRDARTKGIPQLGSGAIYPVPTDEIIIPAFLLPDWYEYAFALDVGWNRTAAIWGARDPGTDILYLWAEHYVEKEEPAIHAHGILSRGKWIPGVIDPASRGRAQKDGEALIDLYRELGLENLTPADNAVEAGLYEVWTRMTTGRLKIFPNLVNFLEEFRIYRRDEKGKIVKVKDHLMDAMRYLVMSGLKVACQKPIALVASRTRSKHQSAYEPLGEMYVLQKG